MLAGGAIGNLIDRVITGYVVDFLDFSIWPVFNSADVAIVTGVGCVMYTMLFLPETLPRWQPGETRERRLIMNNVRQTKALLQIFVLLFALRAVTGFEYWRNSGVAVNAGQGIIVTVKPEMTAKEIGEVLYQNGIIHNVTLVRIIAKVQGGDLLQAGDYALSAQMSTPDIINKMVRGEIAYRLLTVGRQKGNYTSSKGGQQCNLTDLHLCSPPHFC